MFLVAFLILLAGSALLTFHYRLFVSDALSRSYAAAVVMYNTRPGLANLGFIWAPLPSLLQIPFALFRPLLTAGFTGPIVSSLAGASSLVLMDSILSHYLPTRWVRWSVLLAYQGNIMILFSSINGMSEMVLVAATLGCWYHYQRLSEQLPHRNGATDVVLMGIYAGMAFLSRYEAVPFGLTMFLALTIALMNREPAGESSLFFDSQRKTGIMKSKLAIEGYSLTYLAPFAYSIFLWVFFNWQIMGNPFYFMVGRGSNAQWLQGALSSSPILAAMYHNFPASFSYAFKASGLVFPAFYLMLVLLLFFAIHRHDWFASALVLAAVSFPGFQALLFYEGQSFGWTRFFTYIIPFSVIGLAYAFYRLSNAFRARALLWYITLIVVVGASSAFAPYGIAMPDVIQADEVAFIEAVVQDQAVGNFALEMGVADYVAKLPDDGKVLADDLVADRIILFTRQFDRFVTTRSLEFDDVVRNPVGKASYILVTNLDGSQDRIVEQYPNIFLDGAPFVELDKAFAGRGTNWRVYRVVNPTTGSP
ncbi:MAG: hypothetical protein M1370_10145 [Bacteroidetes bacterium]|nr:hypothetical protein [Bacteroidota bacterium]MCL5024978.1 hypothetical protein [Chloroflexota bacterium]